ncbi:MAG: cytochrome C oxidase subunit IV family protein [Siphonobacter sp.]
MAHEYSEYIEKGGKYLPKAQTKVIWKTFWILLIITALEFVVAFSLPNHLHVLKAAIFIGMTLIKAGYIVGEFMHLGQEVKALLYTILVPIVFLVWLVIALLLEGGFIASY